MNRRDVFFGRYYCPVCNKETDWENCDEGGVFCTNCGGGWNIDDMMKYQPENKVQ